MMDTRPISTSGSCRQGVSFTGLEMVCRRINMKSLSSFMAAVVEEVMDHQQECDRYDRLQRLEDPEELIFWTAVNCYQEKEWEALDWEGRKEDREEEVGGQICVKKEKKSSFDNWYISLCSKWFRLVCGWCLGVSVCSLEFLNTTQHDTAFN